MSFIGATGYNENQEELDTLKDNIDANSSYINNLVGIPDPLHTAIFGINLLNPGLFGLVERAEVNIKALQTGLEGEGTTISGIETTISGIETTISGIETEVSGIQTEILGIQGEITGIQGEITGIDSTISAIQFVELPLLTSAIGATDVIAVDARNKANRALDIWDYSGDNVYHKKTGNVGIGNTFGSVLSNKLEVQGNINIPTGSTFRIGDEPFNYSHLAGEQPVSSKWTNATDVDTNIYYNTGNVGIGITTAINNKMEVNGNLNISAGSKYKINNVNLAFSDLGGSLSYNSLTNQLTGGTNIQILNGVINNTYTYTLPTATTNAIGGVRPDGTTILINNGVISSTAGLPATIRLTPTPTDGFYSWINSQALLAKTPSTGVLYSSGSADGDIVLRSDTDKALILQSGIGDPAITFTGGTNRVRIHQRVGINTLPNTNYWLDVNGSINATEIRVGGNLIPISQWITSGANIYYSSGNVGIGTNANIQSKLTINGINTETANSFDHSESPLTITNPTPTSSSVLNDPKAVLNLCRNGTANQTFSARACFKLCRYENSFPNSRTRLDITLAHNQYDDVNIMSLQSGGNVGIGTTAPQNILHLHRTATAQDVRIILTDGTTTAGRGFHIVKTGDRTTYIWNLENSPLIFGTNETERMRIEGGGNINIDRTLKIGAINNYNGGAITKLQVYSAGPDGSTIAIFKHPNDSQGIGIRYDGIYQTNSVSSPLTISSTGTGGLSFKTNDTEKFRITENGLRFQDNIWHATLSGNERLYFGNNSTTYIKGYGGTQPIEFRNGADTPIAWFNYDGEFTCMLESQTTTDSDHIIIRANTALTQRGRYRLLIGYNTFTGFHRCYYEDDEIFNNNMLKEEIDIFKNNYKGRIVISTGKIKTDFTRDVPKTEEQRERGVRAPTTQNEEEEVKIEDITEEEAIEEPPPISSTPNEETKSEWYSAIDKNGITIEDALPIIQLCRSKKDKRVYGVIGSPTRSTNNLNRLIVNSVGEGAICVCNSNGNIENGDYIQSSELLGFGEKQDDDILHNYSVAKAVMDCNFDLDSPYYQCYELEGGVMVAFIACTYHCG